ncbi:MAG: hypothetical protein QM786_10760 [Breznakibacter sp.]
MANNTSPHILGTSTNLLGFCLFIITSFHLTKNTENTMIDEFTSVIALLLTLSSLFSFFSIRTNHARREVVLEKIADYLFVTSLLGILSVIVFIVLFFLGK